MLDGLKHIFRLKDFYLLAFIMFITGTVFNGVSTWVEVIVRPKGFDINQAGTIGGMLLLGGILGVFILPPSQIGSTSANRSSLFGLVLAIPFPAGADPAQQLYHRGRFHLHPGNLHDGRGTGGHAVRHRDLLPGSGRHIRACSPWQDSSRSS
jgi:hypothetical protein